jgi:putative FmdB family regulatory protein
LYAYRCTQCGHRFEKIQNFSAEPETTCPKCQGELERPLTAPRLHFKGAGWYVNDYAAKSSESDTASAPAEAKDSGSSDAKAPAKDSKPATESKPAAESKPASTESTSKPASTSGTT